MERGQSVSLASDSYIALIVSTYGIRVEERFDTNNLLSRTRVSHSPSNLKHPRATRTLIRHTPIHVHGWGEAHLQLIALALHCNFSVLEELEYSI